LAKGVLDGIVVRESNSNALQGFDWSVRQVYELIPHRDPSHSRAVEGRGCFRSDSCTAVEFADWAKEKLLRNSLPDGY